MATTVYKGNDGQFYWRYRSRNGQVSATGGEGYSTRSNARRAARRIGIALAVSKVINEE